MTAPPSEALIARLVREVVAEMRAEEAAGARPSPEAASAGRARCAREPWPVHGLEAPHDEALLRRLVATTSSLLGVGRTGTRFPTDLYLRIREGHADAKDAVHTEVPDEWPRAEKLLSLVTRCKDRHEYLLYPNQGRRLDDASRTALEREGKGGADVQVILGDGLSPLAILKNGLETLRALEAALASKGLRSGRPLFVRFARIGVADEIGVLLGARATAILVGERPGLGTGDSLSIYIAISPKLDQDNAEKNCISNVRPIGIRPAEAAALAATVIQRGLERGGGGVALGVGYERR